MTGQEILHFLIETKKELNSIKGDTYARLSYVEFGIRTLELKLKEEMALCKQEKDDKIRTEVDETYEAMIADMGGRKNG